MVGSSQRRHRMNADPVCAKSVTTPQKMETYMVGADGKSLGNVFVYVKEGLRRTHVRRTGHGGHHRPERVPLPSARLRHSGWPAARNPEQRPDAAQHSRGRGNNREFNNGQPIP